MYILYVYYILYTIRISLLYKHKDINLNNNNNNNNNHNIPHTTYHI